MKHLLLVSALLLVAAGAHSCTCAPAYDARGFCQVVDGAKSKPMFCVVKARVLSYYHWGMYVEVQENIYNTATNDTVLVWGDMGATCRPTFTGWAAINIGDTLVMSLEQTDLMGNFIAPGLPDYEDSADYVLQGCGAYFMRYNNGIVTGGFNDNLHTDTMDYETFKAETLHCLPALPSTNIYQPGLYSAALFPNPSSTYMDVQLIAPISKLVMLNCMGQTVLEVHPNATTTRINLEKVPSGIYTLTLYTDDNKIATYYKAIRE